MKQLFSFTWFGLLLLSISCTSCQHQTEPLHIAVSWERSQENKYTDWLRHQQIDFNFTVLYPLSLGEIDSVMALADGLLLTGGNDIYPAWYGKEYDTARCGVFNHRRDTLEMHALTKAIEMNMPVLGICRGMQLINVHQGGTLYVDLPEDTGSGEIHRGPEYGWTTHRVQLEPGHSLAYMTTESKAAVASNHHQGIEKLAPSLVPLAYSTDDMLIEAVGFAETNPHPFLLAVQWHPEWMDYEDRLSGNIAATFLQQARQYDEAIKE